jgi:hypothetical protein
MVLDQRVRYALLAAALAATLAAVWWASRQEAGGDTDLVVAVEERRAPSLSADSALADSSASIRAEHSSQAGGALDLSRLSRNPSLDPRADLFGPRDFTPPPPRKPIARPGSADVAAPAESPPPPPPPVPFSYIGRLAEGAQTTIFLASADRNFVVRKGDVIDNTYRVEEIGPATLVLTYLPRNVRQTIPIGAPQ